MNAPLMILWLLVALAVADLVWSPQCVECQGKYRHRNGCKRG